MTRDLVALFARLNDVPAVLINGSAIGWYGVRDDEVTEATVDATPGFSHDLCAAWEKEAINAELLGVRVVRLRIGLVMDVAGGMLAQLLPVYSLGLGGPMGHGRQWMSWISRDDLVRLIAHTAADVRASGPVNAVAPNPVTANAFSKAIGKAVRRPVWFRIPAKPLEWVAGDMARELFLGGQKLKPVVAQELGFEFLHQTFDQALRYTLGDRYRGKGADSGSSDASTEARS